MKKIHCSTSSAAALAVALLYCGAGGPGPASVGVAVAAPAEDGGAEQLRQYIDQQVGGLQKFVVPDEAHLPQPLLSDGTPDPRYKTTEAKRYLGKLLYFDPVRTARILPRYGGVLSTKQTSSCGDCHLGEAASRANTILNFGVGGEGRGYTDESGKFIARRRIQPGLVDVVPTLTEICTKSATINCANPTDGLHPRQDLDRLVESGRADAVDSVARNVPDLIGFAFNNRLLQGGLAGDPAPFPLGVNPDGLVWGFRCQAVFGGCQT